MPPSQEPKGRFPAVSAALGAPRRTSGQQDSGRARRGARVSSTQISCEDAVLWIVNEVRKKAGLPRLVSDERLRAAARAHSRDMARRRFCAHVNPDGVTPEQRMRAAGFPNPGGENVAHGQEKPHAVMTAWMESPGHRANILNPEFATIGVGVEFGAGGPYWTQNFGY